MKKALLLVSILFISVISTACINNFAVQELNNKAKAYIEAGDYQNAIERLKSSLDLDDSVFETHYNLAVAYTMSDDYQNAINAYIKALAINPEFADGYYSLAVAEENLAKDITKGVLKVDENNQVTVVDTEKLNPEEEVKLADSDKLMINNLCNEAVTNYNKYLSLATNAQDKQEILAKIQELQDYDKKYLQAKAD